MTTNHIAPSYGLYYQDAPQQEEAQGAQTWFTRSNNVVAAITKVSQATVLERADNPDEYMLLLPPGVHARVSAGDASISAAPESLTIIPPGSSRIEVTGSGHVVRVFSARARDLAVLAPNAQVYAEPAPTVAPLQDWPMPVEGYKLRNYTLAEYSDPKIFGRIFRSRNLMINVFERKTERRDPRKLTPHSHADFEQISLAMEGTFIHHLRKPWGPDSAVWREDQHVTVHSPSTIVIPTDLIHTTQDIGEGVIWLVDIFGPPRMDFSSQPGVVRNAAEYPMPQKA